MKVVRIKIKKKTHGAKSVREHKTRHRFLMILNTHSTVMVIGIRALRDLSNHKHYKSDPLFMLYATFMLEEDRGGGGGGTLND